MRDKLISWLKQHYLLYNLIHSLYWKINFLKIYILGTDVEEKKWSQRGINEIKNDFSNLNHSHRYFLIEEISKFYPFSHVLEIGCGYAPNLYLLSKKFPSTKFVGIDINHLAIQEGKKWLLQLKVIL